MIREALVWNTRLRMEEGVGVAGNCVGLFNSQTTKRDSIALEEDGGVVYSKHRG
jgi:hypothetical protein